MSAQTQFRPVLVPETRQKPSRRRRSILVALLLLCVLAAAGWTYTRQDRELEVQVVSPTYQNVETTVSSTGVVTPVHDFQARANFSGIVEQIYVHVGEKVHAGQMLIHMKDQYAASRLDSARAALQSAEVTLRNAEQNGTPDERIRDAGNLAQAQADRDAAAASLATLQKLAQRGSVSESEVLAAESKLKQAEGALENTRETISHRYTPADIASLKAKVRADEDSVAAERVSWGNAYISTPISGTVYIVPVSPYDFVPGGGDLLRVADLQHLEVRASFFEDDIGELQLGQPVTIHWDGAPDKSWAGRVISRPLAVQQKGSLSTGECVIALTSPDDGLPIDSTVVVNVTVQKHAHVLAIPRQALYGDMPHYFVYRVDGSRLRKTPVKIGLFNAMQAEITGGLTGRDTVALRAKGDKSLSDGRRIAIAQNP